jgi:hypothetical protein
VALAIISLPSCVTTAAATLSSPVRTIDDAFGLTIYAPLTLSSTSNTVLVEPTSTGNNFVILQSGGVDVIFEAGKATVISPVTFRQIKISGNTPETGDRTFVLTKAVLT